MSLKKESFVITTSWFHAVLIIREGVNLSLIMPLEILFC